MCVHDRQRMFMTDYDPASYSWNLHIQLLLDFSITLHVTVKQYSLCTSWLESA